MLPSPKAFATVLSLAVVLSGGAARGWRQEVDDPGTDDGFAYDSAVDAAGDVIVAGMTMPVANRIFTVIKFDGPTGAQLWRYGAAGSAVPGLQYALDVVADGTGDVVAAGLLQNAGTDRDFTVVKLAGANGMEVWRREVDGPGSGSHDFDEALAVTVDGNGDVLAVGLLAHGADDSPLTVLKFAGGTGTELWRAEVDGARATDIAVDGANNVVVTAFVSALWPATDFLVVKLAGSDGGEQWRTTIASGVAYDLAIDGVGDVVAVGSVGFPLSEFFVTKLAGSSGAEVWQRQLTNSGGIARAVAFAGGDVVVAGGVENQTTSSDWRVVKLAAADGADVWIRDLTGSAQSSEDGTSAVAVNGAGDVVVAGILDNARTTGDLAVVQLDGGSGQERWRQAFDGTQPDLQDHLFGDHATAIAVGAADQAVVSGVLYNHDPSLVTPTGSGLAVLALSPLDGAVGPVAGRKLIVSDRAGDPAARRVVGILSDPNIVTAPGGSAGDPTSSGGTLMLENPMTLETATLSLPASGWRALGNPPGSRGYKYADAGGSYGPCKTVIVKPRRLRAVCAGTIPFSLDEPAQGLLTLSVRLGTAAAQCASFGGDVRRDAGTSNPGPAGQFIAWEAAPFSGDCP